MSNITADLFRNGVYKHLLGFLGNIVFDLVLVTILFLFLSWVLRSVIEGVLFERFKGAYDALGVSGGEKSNKGVLNVTGGVILALIGYYFGYRLNLSSMESNLGSLVVVDNVISSYRLVIWFLVIALAGIYCVLIYSANGVWKRRKEVPVKIAKGYVIFGRCLVICSYLAVIVGYVSAFWLLFGVFR